MSRYVFFNSDAQDAKVLTAAKKTARSRGATVVKSLAGTMLLEVTPAQVPEVAQALFRLLEITATIKSQGRVVLAEPGVAGLLLNS